MGAVSKEAKAKAAKRREELVQWYKDHGICPRCKGWAEPGRVYCKNCVKKTMDRRKRNDPTGNANRAYCVERRKRLKEAGLCVYCGKRVAIEGKVLCSVCKAKNQSSQEKYNLKKRLKREAEKERAKLMAQNGR